MLSALLSPNRGQQEVRSRTREERDHVTLNDVMRHHFVAELSPTVPNTGEIPLYIH